MNKKRAAPKPPPQAAGSTSTQAPGSGSTEKEAPVPKSRKDVQKPPVQEVPKNGEPNANEQTEKVKNDEMPRTLPENVTLKVVLPDQTVKEAVFPSSTAMIDLRMQLCALYKLPQNLYTVEPIQISDGRSIPFQPSHTLAALAAKAVTIKSKAREPARVLPPKVPEQTVRLTIKMSRSQQQVMRVSPRLPLSKIYPQIIEKFGVSADSHLFMELRHPEQKDMTLDISRCLDDYKIRELFLADKRAQNSVSSVTIEDIPHYREDKLHSPSVSTTEKEKKGGLKLSSLFKRSKKHKQKKDGALSLSSQPPPATNAAGAPLQQQPQPQPQPQQKPNNSNNSNSKVQEEMPEKKKRAAPVKPVTNETESVTNETLKSEISSKIESAESLKSDSEGSKQIEQEYHELHETLPQVKTRTKRKAPPVPPPRTSILSSAEDNQSPHLSERFVKKKAPTPPGMHSREESIASNESSPGQISDDIDEGEPASPKQKPTKPPRNLSNDLNAKEVSETLTVADVQVEIQEENDEDSSETRNALTDSLEKAVDQIDQVLEDANDSDAEENHNATWRDEDGIEVIDLVTKKTDEEIQTPSSSESERSGSPAMVESVEPTVEDELPEKKVLKFAPDMLEQEDDDDVDDVDDDGDDRDEIISPEKHFDPNFGQASPLDDFDFMTKEAKVEENEQERSEIVSTEMSVSKENEIERESFPLPLPEETERRSNTPSPLPEPTVKEQAPTMEPSISIEKEYSEEDIDEGTFDPDDETVQEIEKVKAQIAKMRRKKAEKALEQSKPFKIVRETNSNTKGPKTFTFVPNQQRKAVFRDYDVAPSIGINLSESGEIQGLGAPVPVKEGDKKTSAPLAVVKNPAPEKEVVSITATLKTNESEIEKAKVATQNYSQGNGKVDIPNMIPEVIVIEKSSSKMPSPVAAKETKKVGGYVSSAALRHSSDVVIRPKTSSANNTDDVSSKRKSALPNYYKRFLGVQSFKHAGEENNNNEPDSWIKPVTSPKMQDQHKVIEAVYKIPKKQDGTTIEKKAVQPEDLPPPPPPENHTSLQVFSTVEIHEVEDLPLPPPPDDFLSPPEKESNVFQSPTKHYGSSSSNSFDSSDQGSPVSPSSNSNLSPTYLGVASAKPFSPVSFGGKTKFRPMSAVLQDDPNSPQHDYDPNNNPEVLATKGAIIDAKSILNPGDNVKQSGVHANVVNQSHNKFDNSKKQNLNDYEAREAILSAIQQGNTQSTLKKTRKIENTRTVVPGETK